MTSRSLRHRAPLLWLVVPYLAGLVLGKIGLAIAPLSALGVALLASTGAIVAARRAPRGWAPAIVVAMISAGIASYELHRARLPERDGLPPREVRVAVRVERVFAQVDSRRVSGLATIVRTDEHLRELARQRVYFSLALRAGERAPIRTAVLNVVGVLAPLPRNPPANTFDSYLAGAGMNFRLTRGRIVGEERAAHPYYRFCADTAERIAAVLGRGIEEKRPHLAGLLRAIMLGASHELNEEQHALFLRSGTMHLFAISGLHIGVIAAALQALLLLARLPPLARFALGAGALWLFVDITGASPSAVRAFAMVFFLQAAWLLQRPANLLAALIGSAFAVLLIFPLQLFSASFLMSYGIVAALLVLGLPLGEAWLVRWTLWRDLPKPAWRWWQHGIDYAWRATATALSIGVATTLVSLLTGVEFFGLLTPGALLANLILIPAAGLVTLGGVASILCAGVGFAAGSVLCNHASALLLLWIENLVRVSVQLPGAFVPAHFVGPWIGMTALAILIAALLAGYAADWQPRRGGWWPPFAVVALTLIFGVTYGVR